MFEKITIIGMGLIGSSLARNIHKKSLAKTLVAADFNEEVCQKVEDLCIADQVTSKLASGVEGAEIVILAVPVCAMRDVMREIAPCLRDDVLISDVGSVKMSVIQSIQPLLRSGMEYVPAHPIAGTEFSGPEAGFEELFQGRWCILTPLPETSIKSVEKITALWEKCGSMIEIMDPKHHDLVLGITSHLPHLIAYTIVDTANTLEDDLKSEVIKFSASGFRDFTRIASSDPTMWRDIFLSNKTAVLEILQRFSEDLTGLQKAIRNDDGAYLHKIFTETRDIRKQIIDQGQSE
jgi:cyclohexadieny/prephenate dehydrogenase